MAAQPQREWLEKDYYAVLGVSPDAPAKEITRAYRKIARENHPDARPGDAAAEDRFKEASSAYDVLGDAEKRPAYDQVRTMGARGFGGFGPGGSPGGSAGFNFEGGDIGDLLGNLFGQAGGRRAGGAGPRRGADLEATLTLPFDAAVTGITTTIGVTSEAACSTCSGSGAAPGSSPRTCTVCGGRGTRDDNQGLFSFSQVCAECGGRGQVVDTPCPACGGRGTEHRQRRVKVRIPAGVEDGQRIRLKGKGGPGRNGGPPGDLFVRVSVGGHPIFGRRGRDLTVTVPVTFPEAALGAKVWIPTLDGDGVTIKVPAGTASGTTLRVKGKGVPANGSRPPGDLLATVDVAVPSRLSRAQRKAVEALADATEESPRTHFADATPFESGQFEDAS
jgi:molecular chaperone DnaJ